MRVITLLLLAAATTSCIRAKIERSTPATAERQQSEADVLVVVNRLWEAMRTNDSVMARSVFDSSAQLARIVDRNGARFVRWDRADGFVKAVGSAKEPWIERMVAPEVRVDGNLASVWTWYDFSIGGKVSHCGYDSIELAKLATGWKIIYLADTQQRTGCEQPPASK
jgi:hypothetical protein